MGKVYIIANNSRQSGKSTSSVNLAICFATLTQRTLLIDVQQGGWLSELCAKGQKGRITLNTFLTYQNAGEITEESLSPFDKVLIDCPIHKVTEVMEAFKGRAELIVPVECEYFGMNTLPAFLRKVDQTKMEVKGFLPVMLKPGSKHSTELLDQLKYNFGEKVLPPIQRNFYLAKQKDFVKFVMSELTQRAGVTYLKVANHLL
ncbi:ParA family protein [Jiulongibacter sp. NS-SX5]|uniref:ParA family protein n=1 Tax=Jiulongibacter sp. NS-SX5 TaxID=3463854 RepID=UPI004059424C